ncbi:ABC-type glycerol-3-phosphate transport system permease component, partial [Microbacterium foliorum]|nr:ABC-type glycerol-3-phosphate transport system permease component [Microbacterium foliorum]
MSATTAIVTGTPLPTRRDVDPNRRGARDFLRRLPIRLLIAVLLLIEIYPILWMILGSFKTQNEFLNEPFWALPQSWDIVNYIEVFTTGEFGKYIVNSVIAVFPSLAIILVFGTAAGFALEVMVWKGRGTVLLLFLAGIMVPAQMILLPLFTIYFRTN